MVSEVSGQRYCCFSKHRVSAVYCSQDDMHIGAGYAEVWVTKAIKQWLVSEGGDDALKASFRMEITLDGQLVCSK
jgi:hypothetical protein